MRGRWKTSDLFHPRRWGIVRRVLALVLLGPTLATVIFVAVITPGHQHAIDQAEEVQGTVELTSRLLTARTALFAGRVSTQAVAAARMIAINPKAAAGLVDQGASARLGERRDSTDAALEALGPESPVTTADLAAARHAIDTGPPDLAVTPLRPLEHRLDAAIAGTLVDGRASARLSAGASESAEALNATRAAILAADAAHRQLAAVAQLSAGLGDRNVLVAELVAANTTEEDMLSVLDEAPAVVRDRWRAIRRQPATQRYLAVADQLAAPSPTPFPERLDAIDLAQFARDGLEHAENLVGLVPGLTDTARVLAAEQRATAENDLRVGIAAPLAAAASGVAIALYLALTFSRPYRRLSHHADLISSGDLDVEPLAPAGAPEVIAAYGAFNELVANLRLIDAKSQALADLDFDAPVLAEPLPGRLGASLQQSARALSGSIGERDDLHLRLLQQATHDALTGLHNRAAAADHLEQAVARARRSDDGVAVLHLDLDDFKRINETHGNAVGDTVLCEVAMRLRAVAGDATFVARLGGDEFVVVAEDIADPGEVNELARRLRRAVARPVTSGAIRVVPGASIGVAFTWNGEDAAYDVLAWAELAVHRAKKRAAGGVELYDQGLQQQLREVAEIEDALTAALPRDELFLQYQPVIDLATGRMSSVEALVRWQRPDVGMQPPDSFIPIAERSDLIVDLDNWVMARAARQIQEWADTTDLGDIQVAVNVSGRHLLSQTLHDHVVDFLQVTGISPRQLVIEITETVLVNDMAAAAAQLEAVRGLGIRIALDDFGTGYTSITHLRQLPIDIIKIDRSFVQRLSSEKDRTLLAMITDLGHHLGLTITAEGVETAEQYEMLRELGCDRAQGYLMSRPLPAADLATWARDQAAVDQDETPVA